MNKRERIEKAVIDLGGVWPGRHETYCRLVKRGEKLDVATAEWTDGGFDWEELCTRAEFEHVAGDFKQLYRRYFNITTYIYVPSFENWLLSPQMFKEAKSIFRGWRTPLPTELPKSWRPEVGGLACHESWGLPIRIKFLGERIFVAEKTDHSIGDEKEVCGFIHMLTPIKSERERVIEAVERAAEKHTSLPANSFQLGVLYDIGALKMPDEN